jgi:hypothetical protein
MVDTVLTNFNPGRAAGFNTDGFAPKKLFTGDTPVTMDYEPVSNAADMEVLTVVMRHTDGTVIKAVWDDDPIPPMVGITATKYVHGVTGATIAKVSVYKSGCFNPDVLVWDASFDTDEKKRLAFEGHALIQMKKIGTPDA